MDEIKLWNIKTEMLLIKAFCKSKKKKRSEIISLINNDYFGSKAGKYIWKRVKKLYSMQKLPAVVGWKTLSSDPKLHKREFIIDTLENYDDIPTSTKMKFIKRLIENLFIYKQKRESFTAIENAYEQLVEAETVDEVNEALIPVVATSRELSLTSSIGSAFLRVDSVNMLAYLRDWRKNSDGATIVKTLWPQFDAINAGISFGSVMTIAATTGGGKSTVAALNLMFNFALQGFQVSNVSLEMPKAQLMERSAAFVSGLPLHKIRTWSVTDEEEKHIYDSSNLFNNMIAKNGGAYWILDSERDLTIEEILTMAYEKSPHVILIDYINLVKKPKGMDLKDHLSEIARVCKMFAKNHNCMIILLAQLNDDNRVKYAKAVEEHCVVGNSYVDTHKGLLKIGDILPTSKNIKKAVAEVDFTVTTAQGKRKAKRWYKKGKKDCIGITTKMRRFQVTGSVTTKVLTLEKDLSIAWKNLNEITKDDYIAIKRNDYCWGKDVVFDKIFDGSGLKYKMPYKSPSKMTPELARVCGYLIAEGHLKGHYTSFCNGNENIINDYTKLFNKLLNADKEYKWRIQAGAYYCNVASRIVGDFFDYIGCKGDSRSKEIPWAILQSSEKCAIEFLRGYFTGDMSTGYSTVTYSKKLAKQLQILLLKLGIVAIRKTKKDGYERLDKSKSSKLWKINITGPDKIIFNHKIGLLFRKTKEPKTSWRTETDYIPYIIDYLKERKVGKNSYKTENGENRLIGLKKYLGSNICTHKKIKNKKFLKALKEHFPSLYKNVKLIIKT